MNKNILNTPEVDRLPWNLSWNECDLESVTLCPVCGSNQRTVIYDKLIDNVFFVAPGRWTMKQCNICKSGYLDPRPTLSSIGRAYNNYYTHTADNDKLSYDKLSYFRRVRRQLVNGYLAWKYSSNALPANKLGVLLAHMVPGLKTYLDREYRHLPNCKLESKNLLDLGSGNGWFLGVAKSCGWTVCGLDPDMQAVETAVDQGFTVYQGSIDYFKNETEIFDVITLSHVIEHLHDPYSVLQKCFQLLKPGGQVWIETPNIESSGHSFFKDSWRGIETPRHLVLFNRKSMKSMLLEIGFNQVNYMPRPSAVASLFTASFAILKGMSPYSMIQLSWKDRLNIVLYKLKEYLYPRHKELVTVVAKKI